MDTQPIIKRFRVGERYANVPLDRADDFIRDFPNAVLDRPFPLPTIEGVSDSAVMGMLAGAGIGGGTPSIRQAPANDLGEPVGTAFDGAVNVFEAPAETADEAVERIFGRRERAADREFQDIVQRGTTIHSPTVGTFRTPDRIIDSAEAQRNRDMREEFEQEREGFIAREVERRAAERRANKASSQRITLGVGNESIGELQNQNLDRERLNRETNIQRVVAENLSEVQDRVNALREKERSASTERRSEMTRSEQLRYDEAMAYAKRYGARAATPMSIAQHLLDDARQVVERSQSEGGFGAWRRGFSGEAFNPETWTFGIADMIRNTGISRVLAKLDDDGYLREGETLTREEEILLDAFAENLMAHAMLGADIPRQYMWGETGGHSLAFMASFALNPIARMGTGIPRKVANWGMRKYAAKAGAQGVNVARARAIGNTLNVGARLPLDVARSFGTATTSQLGWSIADAQERLMDNWFIDVDDDGRAFVSGNTGETSTLEASLKGLGQMMIEGFSEYQGENVLDLFSWIGNRTKFGRGIRASQLGRAVGTYGRNQYVQMVRGVQRRMMHHGIVIEHGEELLETVLNAIFIGDSKISDVWDLDHNVDIFMGILPTTLMFSAARTGGFVRDHSRTMHNLNRFSQQLDQQFVNAADLRSSIQNMGMNERDAMLRETLQDSGLSLQAKEALAGYMSWTSLNEAATSMQQEINQRNAQINAENGGQLYKKSLQEKRVVALEEIHNEKTRLAQQLGELANITEAEMTAMFQSGEAINMTPEQLDMWNEFNQTRAIYEGAVAQMRNEISQELAPHFQVLDDVTRNGNVTAVEVRVGNSAQPAYVLGGNLVFRSDGTINREQSDKTFPVQMAETKEKQIVTLNDILSGEVENTATVKQQLETEITNLRVDNLVNRFEGNVDYQVGEQVEYTDAGGKMQAGMVAGVQNGMVVVQNVDGSTSTMAARELSDRVVGETMQIDGVQYGLRDTFTVGLDGVAYEADIQGISDGVATVHIPTALDADQRIMFVNEAQLGEMIRQGQTAIEAEQMQLEQVQPIGQGAFGNIYDQFRGRAAEAINFLMERREGEAIGALSHPEIGEIDLVWGQEGTRRSDGYGLAKIAQYHPEVLGNLQEIISEMQVVQRSENRVQLESERYQAAVRLEWNNEKKNWLLTAFEKRTPAPTNSSTDVVNSEVGLQNDIVTPQDTGVLDRKDTTNLETTSQNEQNFLNSLPRKKNGDIDHARLTPQQRLQYTEYILGADSALAQAEAAVNKLTTDLSETRSRLEASPMDTALIERIGTLTNELQVYTEYVQQRTEAVEQNEPSLAATGEGGNVALGDQAGSTTFVTTPYAETRDNRLPETLPDKGTEINQQQQIENQEISSGIQNDFELAQWMADRRFGIETPSGQAFLQSLENAEVQSETAATNEGAANIAQQWVNEADLPFQADTRGARNTLSQNQFDKLMDWLMRTGLARNVLTNEQAEQILRDRNIDIRAQIEQSDFVDILRNTEHIETGETRIDNDFDATDAEHNQRKVLVPVYENLWHYADNTNPDVERFDNIDDAVSDLTNRGDMSHISDYYTPVKETRLSFQETWLDTNNNVVELDYLIDGAEIVHQYDNIPFIQEYRNQIEDATIDSNTFDAVEESANVLENDAYMQRYSGEFEIDGVSYTYSDSRIGKYRTITVYDQNENPVRDIQLRITDHTYNPRNNTYGSDFISVEISNRDKGRYAPGAYQLRFDGSNTVQEVAEAVHDRVVEITEQPDLRLMSTTAGEIYGFVTQEDDIWIDSNHLNANTPIHEFGHLWNSFVKENNPALYERGKQLVENTTYLERVSNNPAYTNLTEAQKIDEALAQAIGDRGEALLNTGNNLSEMTANRSKYSALREWLSDVWNWIMDNLGIRNMSVQQVENLTFEQFTSGAVADLLSGEAIRTNETRSQAEQQSQEYFSTHPDRLPLTLSVFERDEFMALRGRRVNPITIQQMLNKQGIKAIEKQLINSVIEEKYRGQKSVDYNELEASVRATITPLERITTSSYADYGLSNLNQDRVNDSEETVILNFPTVEHGREGHFHGTFSNRRERIVNYVPRQLDNNTWIAVEESYRDNANEGNIFEFVGTAGSQEAVMQWISDYNERAEHSSPNVGMYGHMRVWRDGNVTYIAELQSDYFQKHAARRELVENRQEFKEFEREIKSKIIDVEIDTQEKVVDLAKEIGYNPLEVRPDSHFKNLNLPQEITDFKQEMLKEQERKIKELNKQLEQKRNEIYENLTPEEKQFIASQKVWERRLLHEAVREAVQGGAESVRFPTPYTLAVIEGYVSASGAMPYEIILGGENRLFDGDVVRYLGQDYIVTRGEYGNDSIEIASLNSAAINTTVEDFATESAQREFEDIESQAQREFADTDAITVEELQSAYFGGYWDIAQEILLEEANNSESGTASLFDSYNDIFERIKGEWRDRLDVEMLTQEWGYDTAVISDNGNVYAWRRDISETLEQPYVYKEGKNKEDFDISELSDTQQRVLEKYQQYEQQLRDDYGGENVSIVEDNYGFDWVEVELNDNVANRPVVAFQIESAEAPQTDISDLRFMAEAPTQTPINRNNTLQDFTSDYSQFLANVANSENLIDEILREGMTNFQAIAERHLAAMQTPEQLSRVRDMMGDVRALQLNDEQLRYLLWKSANPNDGSVEWKAQESQLVHELTPERLFGNRTITPAKMNQLADKITSYVRENMGRDVVNMLSERQFHSLINRLQQARTERAAVQAINQITMQARLRNNNHILNALVEGKILHTYALQSLAANEQLSGDATLGEALTRLIAGINSYNNYFQIQGQSKRGVSVARNVDEGTRQIIQFVRDNKGASLQTIEQIEQEINDKINSADYQINDRDMRTLVAAEYVRRLNDISDMKASIQELKGADAADVRALHYGAPKWEVILSEQKQLEQMQSELIRDFTQVFETGRSNLLEWKEGQMQRRQEMLSEALEATNYENVPLQAKKGRGIMTRFIRQVFNDYTGSLDFMLQYVDYGSIMGEGAMYNRFMYGEDGVMTANRNIFIDKTAYKERFDAQTQALFGRNSEWLAKEWRRKSGYTLEFINHEGVAETREMTIGELAYQYALWRQEYSRAQQEMMGYADKMEEIKQVLGENNVAMVEWIQDVMLPYEYTFNNQAHITLYGTSMTNTPFYMPVKYSTQDVVGETQVQGDDIGGRSRMSVAPGSWINRRGGGNNLLDLTADLLSVIDNHVQQNIEARHLERIMQDVNFMLNNKRFRNQLNANEETNHANLTRAFQMALGQYRERRPFILDKTLGDLNKLWAVSRIGLGGHTALKQTMSYPAFLKYSVAPAYVRRLAHNMSPTRWKSNVDWALENMPTFVERWQQGNAGNIRIQFDNTSDVGKIQDMIGRGIMLPNRLVDRFTIVAGARAVYEYGVEKYTTDGMSETDARVRALRDAEVMFNQTQQTARREFKVPVQADRTATARWLSTFFSQQILYFVESNKGLMTAYRGMNPQTRQIMINNMVAQYVRNGMNETEAKAMAEKRVNESIVAGIGKAALYYSLQYGWYFLGETGVRIAAELLRSALRGGDDNDTEALLEDLQQAHLSAAMRGGLGMLPGGQLWLSVYNFAAHNRDLNLDVGGRMFMADFAGSLNSMLQEYRRVGTIDNTVLRDAANAIALTMGVNADRVFEIGRGFYRLYEVGTGSSTYSSFEATMALREIFTVPRSTRGFLADRFYFNEMNRLEQLYRDGVINRAALRGREDELFFLLNNIRGRGLSEEDLRRTERDREHVMGGMELREARRGEQQERQEIERDIRRYNRQINREGWR